MRTIVCIGVLLLASLAHADADSELAKQIAAKHAPVPQGWETHGVPEISGGGTTVVKRTPGSGDVSKSFLIKNGKIRQVTVAHQKGRAKITHDIEIDADGRMMGQIQRVVSRPGGGSTASESKLSYVRKLGYDGELQGRTFLGYEKKIPGKRFDLVKADGSVSITRLLGTSASGNQVTKSLSGQISDRGQLWKAVRNGGYQDAVRVRR